jgi:cellulose 1,4-beta-cellobiosidase
MSIPPPGNRSRRRGLAAASALLLASGLVAVATGATATSAAAATARVDNPYVGAQAYVNPDWSAKAAAEPGGSAISNEPTFVWLDSIKSITGTADARGLKAHLDTAVSQGANLVQFVIYDLPGRDCAALASNGELGPTELDTYEHDYIDPIAKIMSDPAYAGLRISTIIEPDSLPNLVTNAGGTPGTTDACVTMKQNGNYEKGVGYALHTLGAIPNVYNYIDAGHHAWLGWDSNLDPAVSEFKKAATTSGATVDDVAGFITNTANYSALKEPYFSIGDSVNGTSVRQSKWVDWNNYVDELSFAQALRSKLVSAGFRSDLGMLIDTARNGWGGPARPTGPAPKDTLNGYVDGSRLDKRIHAGNWCNQSGAGIGERPTTAPEAGIDAYVWAKPPGESDGSSSAIANDEGKGFDRMCDPTYGGNARNGYNMSGALPNAPLAGHWFSAQFQQLLANAYPPLTGGGTTGGTTTGGSTTGGTTTGGTTTGGTTTGGTTTGGSTTGGTTTGACTASYTVVNDWGSGFIADVTVKAGSDPLSSWKVTWTYGGNQAVGNAWNAGVSQAGQSVTATNAGYNGNVPANGSASFGFQGSYSGTNSAPTLTCATG